MAKLFRDIAGQKRAVSMLSAHLNSGNLSHAYLFLGQEGTGKEYLAKEFARYILCDKNSNDDCESCRKLKNDAHPDFIYVNGREGIKIEQVREVIERIGLSPVMSEKKVCLISKAENMGIEAANALLKTLEEPPSDSIIILTSNSEKRLPQTVISRSQIIKLNPVEEKEIFRILEQEFSREEIEGVLSLAEGSVGEAKKMLKSDDALKNKQKAISDIGTMLGSASLIDRFKIIEGYDNKKNLKYFFEILSRSIFGSIIAGNNEEKAGLSEAVPTEMSTNRKVEMAKKILKIYRNLDYNVSLRIALEEIMIKDVISD